LKEILQYLKTQGDWLDTDIAKATGISLTAVRLHLSELAAKHEVVPEALRQVIFADSKTLASSGAAN